MVKTKTKKIIVFSAAALALLAVARCETVETAMDRAGSIMKIKRSAYTEEIPAKELRDFMKWWPDFNELQMVKGADLTTKRPSQHLSWKMRLWFTYHHWDAERFFYVHERLVSILEELKIRRDAESVIASLEGRKDDAAKRMRELQQKRIDSQHISENEMLLVTFYESKLREMFKKYP